MLNSSGFACLLAFVSKQVGPLNPSEQVSYMHAGPPKEWRRKWQPTPVFMPGKFHGQRNLAGYSPWGGRELAVTEHISLCTKMHLKKEKE